MNLENYQALKQLSKLVFYIQLILSFCFTENLWNNYCCLSYIVSPFFSFIQYFENFQSTVWGLLVQKWWFRNCWFKTWTYISLFKLENKTTRMQLKNRPNILLHTILACYTHFPDNYLLISMAIYNFTCLYNIFHHLKEHSARLANFRCIVVYIFYRM